jgi:uncharacterized protein YpbB
VRGDLNSTKNLIINNLNKYKMNKLKEITSYALYTLLAVVFLSSCDNVIYTTEQCKNFKKGDTIYVKEFYIIEKNVVIKNTPELELIEVRNLKYSWDIDILEYDQFRFK